MEEKQPGRLHFKALSSMRTSEQRLKPLSLGADVSWGRPGFGIIRVRDIKSRANLPRPICAVTTCAAIGERRSSHDGLLIPM